MCGCGCVQVCGCVLGVRVCLGGCGCVRVGAGVFGWVRVSKGWCMCEGECSIQEMFGEISYVKKHKPYIKRDINGQSNS